ncbi:hypothetical protein [Dictyobacter kobayashii]|uniref:Uncharacterized protein n=1 Tax=Dictyobacter kobayashii TaxID=2014872 RepID=A0A402AHX1_9CHLR|nr:hypothetical protein [Dictyobacter kobayashii]GCE18634.1 hypothetical protein KDK_24340 [Dictyobacter kobayashii]
MNLAGKVQTAKIGNFFDGIEMVVVDKEVIKPAGGRPQYTCKVVRGWPGLQELRDMRKQGASAEELANYAVGIQLPQEDEVLDLIVMDITGKQGYQKLVCEVAATQIA